MLLADGKAAYVAWCLMSGMKMCASSGHSPCCSIFPECGSAGHECKYSCTMYRGVLLLPWGGLY